MRRAGGAFFALSVPDIEASTRWYTDKFGLSVVQRVPKQNGVAVAILEGGGLTVELIQNDAARPRGAVAPGTGADGIHGVFKAGIVVENLDQTLAALRALGVVPAFGPFPARDGQPANAIIRDNAENMIQFLGRR